MKNILYAKVKETPGWHQAEVRLNGEKLKLVQEANAVAGWVEVFDLDTRTTRRLTGKVEIFVPDGVCPTDPPYLPEEIDVTATVDCPKLNKKAELVYRTFTVQRGDALFDTLVQHEEELKAADGTTIGRLSQITWIGEGWEAKPHA